MEEELKLFRSLLDGIAEERRYKHYTANIKAISSGGANYSSHLFVATISAPGKDDIELFAKVAAIGEKLRSSMEGNLYIVEQFFYKVLLKKYKEIEEQYNVPDEHRLVTAKYYASSTENMKETLILENLLVKGYKPFDRFKSFDWTYASFSIKQLALYHALSFALSRYDPDEYKCVKSEVVAYPIEMVAEAIEKGTDNILGAVKEENKKRLTQFLEKPEFKNPVYKLYEQTELPVIIHGDYRPSNMMHRDQDDGSVQVVTLDFQTLQEGNPITDLLYFTFIGSDKKFRDQYLQKLFDLYYTELSAALRRYNMDPSTVYSREQYELDLKKLLPYIVQFSLYAALVTTIDEESAPKINKDVSMDGFLVPPTEAGIERVNGLVEDFIEMGIL